MVREDGCSSKCAASVMLRMFSLGLALSVVVASGFGFKFLEAKQTNLDRLLSFFLDIVGLLFGLILAVSQFGSRCKTFFTLCGWLKFNAGQSLAYVLVRYRKARGVGGGERQGEG